MFGRRLAEFLYSFYKPSKNQIIHRKDIFKSDWNYLKGIKNILGWEINLCPYGLSIKSDKNCFVFDFRKTSF